jgi:hypothetical protein
LREEWVAIAVTMNGNEMIEAAGVGSPGIPAKKGKKTRNGIAGNGVKRSTQRSPERDPYESLDDYRASIRVTT